MKTKKVKPKKNKKNKQGFLARLFTHKRFKLVFFVLCFGIIGATALLFVFAATAVGPYGSVATDQANRTNTFRAQNGKSSLTHIECLNTVAENWARQMAINGGISHNPNLAGGVDGNCGGGWTFLGENVGIIEFNGDKIGASSTIFNGFVNSTSGHKENLLRTESNRMGMGAYSGGPCKYNVGGVLTSFNNCMYVTQIFATCSGSCAGAWSQAANVGGDPATAPAIVEFKHALRDSSSGGSPTYNFKYGSSNYIPIYCDWDGDGSDTPGMYYNGTWYIRRSNNPGPPDITIQYGDANSKPVCGDWNNDGRDSIGVVSPGPNDTMIWYLRRSNNPGPPDITVSYGVFSRYKPVVGDWNNDGKDTIGVYDGGNWYLRNSNTGGQPDINVNFGNASYIPVVGDWNNDGIDTVGVYDKGRWYLRNSNTGGSPDLNFSYGIDGYIPVTGDWNKDGFDTIGVVTR